MIVVLGMHKSGTTLVARMLHEAGIDMVEAASELAYDEGNHYERRATSELNKEVLGCFSANSARVRRRCYPQDIPASVRAKAERLVAQLEATKSNWGFKDPRTCLTYEFWRDVLPAHKVVVIYRDPVEVYRHYKLQAPRTAFLRGFVALRAWYAYNRIIESLIHAGEDQLLVLEYGELMNDEGELKRLAEFVRLAIPDIRQQSLARNQAVQTNDYRLASVVCRYILREDIEALYDSLRCSHKDQRSLSYV